MAQTKNLCAQISLDLHRQICEAREQAGLTTAQYITQLLTEYFEMKKNGGTTTMSGNTRTMAFQIPEELFQRIKAHLERESARTGRKYTQREFVLGLIEEALDAAERQAEEEAENAQSEAPEEQEDIPTPEEGEDPSEPPAEERQAGEETENAQSEAPEEL